MNQVYVTCPSCFESFGVTCPPASELPTELDYDCEVCCRPMFIEIDQSGLAHAVSLDD